MMNDFHFIRPWWFLALLPLGLMLWQLYRQKIQAGGWQKIIPAHLIDHLIQGQATKRHQPFWMLGLAWLIAVIALAGPAWEKLPQPVYMTNTGKVILMDMSMSMRATDLNPDRLTKARFKAIDLIERIDDSDMGLIAYSGDAFVISPLTADSHNLTALIPNLSPDIMPLRGSDVVAGLTEADKLLKNAGYAKGEIYLLTDGIDDTELPEVYDFIADTDHRISVLGIGTPEGAPIKQLSGELLKDSRGSIVIPKLNDAPLKRIAQSTGGVYSRITSTDADIERLASQEALSHEAKKNKKQMHKGDQFKEFGPILVLLILPLAAYAFRRGLVVCLVAGLLSLGTSQPAQADWWNDLWQTRDQQAVKQFEQKNYDQAASTFENEQWKGSSLYKKGDYQGALDQYKKSNTADGYYNQGNAYAKLKQYDRAIDAYEQALAINPDMADAKKNLELLKKLKEQQQKQQQKQKQDQDKQKQQQQKNQQGQDKKDQQKQSPDQQSKQNDKQQQEKNKQQSEQQDRTKQNDKDQQGDKDPQNRKAEQQKQKEQDKLQKQKKPGQEKKGEKDKDAKEQQVKPSKKPLSNEEKEKMQEIQQLLRKVQDDPSILLRNKMRLEYQKRKYQQQNSPPGAKSW